MVVDTMVIAYALLASPPRREEALTILEQCDDVIVPDSIRAELVNTIWQYVQRKHVDAELAIEMLRDAEALFTQVVSGKLLWERSLSLAVEKGHPAYDTLFIALAEMKGTRVVTYDEKMLRTFPEWTISGADFVRHA
jgi:predicted nucleic acid-binding protein